MPLRRTGPFSLSLRIGSPFVLYNAFTLSPPYSVVAFLFASLIFVSYKLLFPFLAEIVAIFGCYDKTLFVWSLCLWLWHSNDSAFLTFYWILASCDTAELYKVYKQTRANWHTSFVSSASGIHSIFAVLLLRCRYYLRYNEVMVVVVIVLVYCVYTVQ